MENLAADRKPERLAGACCGFCDSFMTRDARLKDRFSGAGSSGCSLVYPSQQALITQFPQVGDCVTRQRAHNPTGLTQFAMQTLASFWQESISGRVRELRECLQTPFKCSHFPKTKLSWTDSSWETKEALTKLPVEDWLWLWLLFTYRCIGKNLHNVFFFPLLFRSVCSRD